MKFTGVRACVRVCVDRCLSAETLEKLASVTECACMYVSICSVCTNCSLKLLVILLILGS